MESDSNRHTRVTHNYHDHATAVDVNAYFRIAGDGGRRSGEIPAYDNIRRCPQYETFPTRLHFVLTEMEKEGLCHIASWQPHGRCFVVHNRGEFVNKILRRWFSQNSYASFQRQLNIYGFKRLTAGVDKGGYYHEKFLKGKEFLTMSIGRTTLKHAGPRKPASPNEEPNFYQMPFLLAHTEATWPIRQNNDGYGDACQTLPILPPSSCNVHVHGGHLCDPNISNNPMFGEANGALSRRSHAQSSYAYAPDGLDDRSSTNFYAQTVAPGSQPASGAAYLPSLPDRPMRMPAANTGSLAFANTVPNRLSNISNRRSFETPRYEDCDYMAQPAVSNLPEEPPTEDADLGNLLHYMNSYMNSF